MIRYPFDFSLLSLAIALIPAFVLWVGRQERLQRAALIPNTLWRNRVFGSICIIVCLTWGSFNASEQILNFLFQNVQGISALGAAVRFLPMLISSIVGNIITGVIVHRFQANNIVGLATAISCIATLLMAIVRSQWSYWVCTFPAIILNPAAGDVLFTISSLLISSIFPAETQGLAGGVFNTMGQIGKSVGLALVALIANSVTQSSGSEDDIQSDPGALMQGYRAAFWFCSALNAISLLVSVWGLSAIGNVGK